MRLIKLIDDQVGRILESLEEIGQREQTVILFTSDHGEMLGDHGLSRRGADFYEGLVRVPLIVSWPGHFESGLKSDALVELLDKAPTLLELAGLKVPDRMQDDRCCQFYRGKSRKTITVTSSDANTTMPSTCRMALLPRCTEIGRISWWCTTGINTQSSTTWKPIPTSLRTLWDEPSSRA